MVFLDGVLTLSFWLNCRLIEGLIQASVHRVSRMLCATGGIAVRACRGAIGRPLHSRGDREVRGCRGLRPLRALSARLPDVRRTRVGHGLPPACGAKLKECGRLLPDDPEVSRRKCSSPQYALLRRGIECVFFYRKSRGEPGRGAPPDEASCGPIPHPPRETG